MPARVTKEYVALWGNIPAKINGSAAYSRDTPLMTHRVATMSSKGTDHRSHGEPGDPYLTYITKALPILRFYAKSAVLF